MIAIERDGLRAWCDGYRSQRSMAIFFSMFGDVNAVRGIWAKTLLDRRRGGAISLPSDDSEHLWLAENTRYISMRQRLGHQRLHLVLLHPAASAQITPFSTDFFLVGQNPETHYWERFNRLCPVPMRNSWRDEIWRLGVERQLIRELSGFGVPGVHVGAGPEWVDVVCQAVKEGRLV